MSIVPAVALSYSIEEGDFTLTYGEYERTPSDERIRQPTTGFVRVERDGFFLYINQTTDTFASEDNLRGYAGLFAAEWEDARAQVVER